MSGIGEATLANFENTLNRLKSCDCTTPVYDRHRVHNKNVKYVTIERDLAGHFHVYVAAAHIPKEMVRPEDIQTHPDSGAEWLQDQDVTRLQDVSTSLNVLAEDLRTLLQENFQTAPPEFRCVEVTEKYDNGSVGAFFSTTISPQET